VFSDTTFDEDLATPDSGTRPETRRVRGGIVADISSVAANAIVGTGIKLKIPASARVGAKQAAFTEERCSEYNTLGGLESKIVESTEINSAFGGSYLRLSANPSVCATPYLTVISPDRVIPQFQDNFLTGFITWTELGDVDAARVLRWVEVRDNRERTIKNALYSGTRLSLGKRVALTEHAETENLPEEEAYPEGVDRMCWYSVNLRPNRRRKQSPLGRSDFQGSESLCVAYDLTIASAVQDVDAGRIRIFTPADFLSYLPETLGAEWERERQVYVALEGADPSSTPIQLIQGEIRAEDHVKFLDFLAQQISKNAGYAPVSMGYGDTGVATSGSHQRRIERRTIATFTAKRRYWDAILPDIYHQLQACDKAVFGAPVAVVPPQIQWAPIVDDDPLEAAQRLEAYARAGAVSTETKVRLAQPHLVDTADIQQEVTRILNESGLAADPTPYPTPETPISGF